MAFAEVDIRHLQNSINAILDHIVEDLGIERLSVDKDQYWDIGDSEVYDLSKNPSNLGIGSIVDDIDLSKNVRRGECYDDVYNFVHIWPQLRYVLQKLKK